MSNKSHGNFRQNLAKLAAKTGFLAEIQESHFNFSERTVIADAENIGAAILESRKDHSTFEGHHYGNNHPGWKLLDSVHLLATR